MATREELREELRCLNCCRETCVNKIGDKQTMVNTWQSRLDAATAELTAANDELVVMDSDIAAKWAEYDALGV